MADPMDSRAASSIASASWQTALQQEQDPREREWLCVTRRYEAQRLESDANMPKDPQTLQVTLKCSDRELPLRVRETPMQIYLQIHDEYPRVPLVCALPADLNIQLSAEQRHQVETQLNQRAEELTGTLSMRKLLTWLDNNLSRWISPSQGDDHQKTPNEKEAEQTQEQIEGMQGETAPGRSRRPCHFFRRGKCTNGAKCRFSHERKTKKSTTQTQHAAQASDAQKELTTEKKDLENTRLCKFFARNRCKLGSKCPFLHEKRAKDDLNGEIKEARTKEDEERQVDAQDNSTPLSQEASLAASKSPDSLANEWTMEQQRALDEALKKYPPAMDKKERWQSIAKEVNGKTLNECIDRFKYLCRIVQRSSKPVMNAPSQERYKSGSLSPMSSGGSQQRPGENSSHLQLDAVSHEDEAASSGDSSVDSRIIPQENRVAVELEPVAKGFEIRLQDLFVYQVGTVLAQSLVVQLQCANCPYHFDHSFRLDCSAFQKWCPRCSALHSVNFAAVFAHESSNLCAYLECDNCSVRDVLPSDFLVTCLECGQEALLERVRRGIRAENWCRGCHMKLAMQAKSFITQDTNGVAVDAKNRAAASKASGNNSNTKRRVVVDSSIVPGRPLPKNGACDHYHHSYRWFRFQCCGKAFPCDVCHDKSDCEKAGTGVFASRMICGFCSKEQSSSVKQCECGNQVGTKTVTTRHWEGGKGCRNVQFMSQLDRQKYRGLNKTASNKLSRVGAEAKRRREAVRGGGA